MSAWVTLIGSVASIISFAMGEKLLIKIVTAFNIYLRQKTSKDFQAQVELEYADYQSQWEGLEDGTNGDVSSKSNRDKP